MSNDVQFAETSLMGDIHSLVELEGNFKIIQFIPGTILPLGGSLFLLLLK